MLSKPLTQHTEKRSKHTVLCSKDQCVKTKIPAKRAFCIPLYNDKDTSGTFFFREKSTRYSKKGVKDPLPLGNDYRSAVAIVNRLPDANICILLSVRCNRTVRSKKSELSRKACWRAINALCHKWEKYLPFFCCFLCCFPCIVLLLTFIGTE